jgi:hypothetical protein
MPKPKARIRLEENQAVIDTDNAPVKRGIGIYRATDRNGHIEEFLAESYEHAQENLALIYEHTGLNYPRDLITLEEVTQ